MKVYHTITELVGNTPVNIGALVKGAGVVTPTCNFVCAGISICSLEQEARNAAHIIPALNNVTICFTTIEFRISQQN